MAGASMSPVHRNVTALCNFIHRILLQSCVFFLFFQFVSNILFPDHNADAFRTLITPPVSVFDEMVRLFFSGLSRWDAEHFLHIAQYGYTYEHSIAFFPLYPLLVYSVAAVWYAAIPSTLLSFPTALMISGVAVNIVAFIAAAWALFSLTKNMALVANDYSNSANMAFFTTVLFVFNPANIFFRAMYTESIYAFLTFFGLNCLFWKRPSSSPSTHSGGQIPARNLLECAVCFGLALAVRSNGLLNLGYLIFYYVACWLKPWLSTSGRTGTTFRGWRIRSLTLRRRVKDLLPTIPVFILALISALIPFLFAQYYHYQTFCDRRTSLMVPISYEISQLAAKNGYVLPGDFRNLHWCNESGSSIPYLFTLPKLPYTAVQGKYWRVGLLGYYRLRKLPLFILASPAFVLAICACVHYLTAMRLSNGDMLSKLVNPEGVLPFVVHVVVLAVVGCFFINVEVFTRMLFSSSPLPYWYCASIFLESGEDKEKKNDKNLPLHLSSIEIFGVVQLLWRTSSVAGKAILIWFLGYAIVGTVAFANFLPWT